MTTPVKLVECPRDALQGCARIIPAELKAELLRRLLAAGARHLDCVSFVSPRAVPQMADAEAVLAALGAIPAGTELIGIVLNRRGAERAARTPVTTLGFPYSISATFQWQNARQNLAEARTAMAEIKAVAKDRGRKMAAYISMAFGNPFGDPYGSEDVMRGIDSLAALGIEEFSLADTVGLASTPQVGELFAAVHERFPMLEIGVHLHGRRDDAAAKVRAAYEAGCRRFDSAAGGLGGCPFAGDHLVGNIPTEVAAEALAAVGAKAGITRRSLASALALVAEIRDDYCPSASGPEPAA